MIRWATVVVVAVLAVFATAGCSDVDRVKADTYKEQGDFYYQKGAWPQAHAEFGAAIAEDPDFIAAYIAISYTCRMMGKVEWIKSPNEYGRRMAEKYYQEARMWAEKCLEKDEGNPDAYHIEGLLWWDASKFTEAIEKFDMVLDHDPHHKWANYYKSWCLFLQGVELRGKAAAAKEKGDQVKQQEYSAEVVQKYEEAAKTMEAYLANWDKATQEKAPGESDLKNWIRAVREMAKADGNETEEAKIYMNKIKNAPGLTEKGATEGMENGQPVVHEGDQPPPRNNK
ncbi:MAG: hypothetical protein K8T20_12750 [Planctomycetes bacterium]|nr:hypothetical protein [Planctomycetota bacterium]